MKKRYILSLLFLGVCLVLVIRVFLPNGPDVRKQAEELVDAAKEADLSETKAEDVAVLAVSGVDLRQGEHGRELWRLQADDGNVRRDDGLLVVTNPRFVYHMQSSGQELVITSRSGDVDQKGEVVRFVDDVHVVYADNILDARIMAYDGKLRVLSFPDSASFRGEKMTGAAPLLRWLLDDNLILAEGGVTAHWEGTSEDDAAGSGTSSPESLVAPHRE